MRGLIVTALAAALLGACGPKDPPPVMAVMEEAPSLTPKTEAEAAARLVGKWRSILDEKSVVTITADGVWTDDVRVDDYTGAPELHTESAWRVFMLEDAPSDAPVASLEAGKVYLEVRGSAGPLHYEIGDVLNETMELFYLGRGSRLAFVRVG